MVMDVLNIQGVQRSLERLADLLGKIQKALGEYLERERTSFPRWISLIFDIKFSYLSILLLGRFSLSAIRLWINIFFFFRFYFVGDEDLLEIIGNTKNIARLQKHFKKMFAGVSSILLNEDNSIITGIASREGEEVFKINGYYIWNECVYIKYICVCARARVTFMILIYYRLISP